MRFSISQGLMAALTLLAATSSALNIIVNNDDGFGSANIRELYRLLRAAGHNAWIVAPVSNQSGKGGTEVFTTEAKLTAPSEFDLVPAGAPSFGTDPNDSHIWYYNGKILYQSPQATANVDVFRHSSCLHFFRA